MLCLFRLYRKNERGQDASFLASFPVGEQDGFLRIERATGCGGTCFDRMDLQDDQRLGGFSLFGAREILLIFFLIFLFARL
jgi:hypothetical protein